MSNLTALQLRSVADVIESIGLECGFVSVSGTSVDIDEDAFFRLFAGCVFCGNRRGGSAYVSVTGEKHGVIWRTNVYQPVKATGEVVQERVEISPAKAVAEPTFAIDGEC